MQRVWSTYLENGQRVTRVVPDDMPVCCHHSGSPYSARSFHFNALRLCILCTTHIYLSPFLLPCVPPPDDDRGSGQRLPSILL